jgi:hypothetical protein
MRGDERIPKHAQRYKKSVNGKGIKSSAADARAHRSRESERWGFAGSRPVPYKNERGEHKREQARES